MAEVNFTVGVGRTVVQHETVAAAFAGVLNDVVDVALLPVGDPGRFALGQIAAHREGGFGKVKRVLCRLIGFIGFSHVSVSRPPRALLKD